MDSLFNFTGNPAANFENWLFHSKSFIKLPEDRHKLPLRDLKFYKLTEERMF